MEIFTSYHAKVEQLREKGLVPISISVFFPRYSKSTYPVYLDLAPKKDMLKISWEEYDKRFTAILDSLNPKKVYWDLHKLSQGNDVVLLCYEKDVNECHRKMVGEWISEKLGMEVKEIVFETKKKQKTEPTTTQLPMFK